MPDLYMTDYGEVAISPKEAHDFQMAARLLAACARLPEGHYLQGLANSVKERCRMKEAEIIRVAKWKHENA